ncbi:hypothetical protein LOAG_10906 [Loa loa]|uniref:Uncharacterized protein n=1 Tax=Loa loa TaxID=7209 RepID=A0A1S0TP36_LOALO|nr:hypothetical protein LOAG_10906 [Loa loa]EFO17591.1 hypothetical protein LOAG_10906 [Loa loa]
MCHTRVAKAIVFCVGTTIGKTGCRLVMQAPSPPLAYRETYSSLVTKSEEILDACFNLYGQAKHIHRENCAKWFSDRQGEANQCPYMDYTEVKESLLRIRELTVIAYQMLMRSGEKKEGGGKTMSCSSGHSSSNDHHALPVRTIYDTLSPFYRGNPFSVVTSSTHTHTRLNMHAHMHRDDISGDER